MHEKPERFIHRISLQDGGEAILCFRGAVRDVSQTSHVGLAIRDPDGFVSCFEGRFPLHVVNEIRRGNTDLENGIAAAVFSTLKDSASTPPAHPIRIPGMQSMTLSPVKNFGFHESPSTTAIDWRLDNPTEEDSRSASWMRSHPHLLGHRCRHQLVGISASSDLVDGSKRDCLRTAILAFPFLGKSHTIREELARLLVTDGIPASKPIGLREIALAASGAYGCSVTPKCVSVAMQRQRDPVYRDGHIWTILRTTSLLPASWLSLDDPDCMNLHNLIVDLDIVLGTVARPEAIAKLLSHSGGRWSELLYSFDPAPESTSDREARTRRALRDVSDYLEWLSEELVAPFIATEGSRTNEVVRREIAMAIATDGGGIRSLFGKSKSWHDNGQRPTTRDMPIDIGWESCFSEPPRSHGGIDIVELRSSIDLQAEGQALDHCVGGYGGRCMRGDCRILSVRRGVEHLSTVEFTVNDDGLAVVRQHRSLKNGTPEADCLVAVSALLEDIESGRIRIHRPKAIKEQRIEYDLTGVSPADFRPFIRRDLSRMDWDEFSQAVLEIAEKIAPGAVEAAPWKADTTPSI